MFLEVISLLINVVLGGGLIVTLVTIKSTKKKADTESKQAEMELGKMYVEEFTKNIVLPLKEEFNEKVKQLNKDIDALTKELARFRKAINKTKDCPGVANCPALNELQKSSKDDSNQAV